MKAFLLHPGRDFDLGRAPPPNEGDLLRDLELDTLIKAMAAGDELIVKVARQALITAPANDLATIRHRQNALHDCLNNPDLTRKLYGLAAEALERQRKVWPRFRDFPSSSHG